jgi:hypothetical protein
MFSPFLILYFNLNPPTIERRIAAARFADLNETALRALLVVAE